MKNIFSNKIFSKNRVSHSFAFLISFVCIIACSVLILAGASILFNIFIAFPIAVIDDIAAGENRPEYIFENITELQKLVPIVTEKPSDDAIEDVEPVDSFVATVMWENSEFDVYAYIFENSEQTKEYVKRKTKRPLRDETGFLGYGNMLYSTTIAVYDKERLIIVYGPSQKKTDAFYLWLQEDFSIPIR